MPPSPSLFLRPGTPSSRSLPLTDRISACSFEACHPWRLSTGCPHCPWRPQAVGPQGQQCRYTTLAGVGLQAVHQTLTSRAHAYSPHAHTHTLTPRAHAYTHFTRTRIHSPHAHHAHIHSLTHTEITLLKVYE